MRAAPARARRIALALRLDRPLAAAASHPTAGEDALGPAYAHCRAIARRSGSSFLAAFWLFPRAERDALHAIYAFCRLADDIADDPSVQGDRRRLLERWREELGAAYRGKAEHPVGVALGDAVTRFRLPEAHFLDLLDGIEQDLEGAPIETFTTLERYCYCVASTVGLLVCAVRGARSPAEVAYATELGIAVQLTNVLRDVGPDAREGRVYLATEDLRAFGVTPASLAEERPSAAVQSLLREYVGRARARYARADALLPETSRRLLRPAHAMGAIYRDLLETLAKRRFERLVPALRSGHLRRLAIAAKTGWGGKK
ncbi:MAG: squalene/phytoene synthase family protein [Myxococcota bacterium]